MVKTPDTPTVARRREREKRTISHMVAIYCAGNHEAYSGRDSCFS